jgi:hypothetical protein
LGKYWDAISREIATAYYEMAALEAGEIVNKDENRMLGIIGCTIRRPFLSLKFNRTMIPLWKNIRNYGKVYPGHQWTG